MAPLARVRPSGPLGVLLVVAVLSAVPAGLVVSATPALAGGPAHQQPASQAPETAVRLAPASSTVGVGETTTVAVVVTGAEGGVGAADVTVRLTNESVGEITGASAGGDPPGEMTTVSVADGNESVRVATALADTNDTGQVRIATVTVRTTAVGTTDLAVTVDALGTEQGESYSVTDVSGATLVVEAGAGAGSPADPGADSADSDGAGDTDANTNQIGPGLGLLAAIGGAILGIALLVWRAR